MPVHQTLPRPACIRLFILAALAGSGAVQAQTPPDAGSLLRIQPAAPAAPAVAPRPPTAPEADIPDSGPKVLVKRFHIRGAVLVAEAELQARLQPAIGQQLSLRQLQGLAASLVALYAERGFLARIVLPPQDIQDGIVELQIIEGRRGSLRIDNQSPKLDTARLGRFIDQRLGAGEAMNIGQLGEALNILNEQPGVSVRSTLVPGQGEAEVDLVVHADASAPVSHVLGANNHGARATGEAQGSVGVTLNNPTGHLDSLAVLANATEGIVFGRLEYSMALGDSGLRVGVNASKLDYRVTQDDFAALDAEGTADSHGLTVSYPLANRTDLVLRLEYKLDEKRLVDHTVAGEIGNRRVQAHSIGISGHVIGTPDSLLGAGVLSFGAALTSGDSEQHNDGALALDAITRRSQGHYEKLAYHLGYLLPLAADWSLNATLRGQFASKNLDSSERLSLGGASGIRAYPVAEATGDEGWLASLSIDNKLRDNLTLKYFLDAGSIKVNHSTWAGWNAGNPDQRNRYELFGAGIGLDWRISRLALLNISVATPLGNNPGRDASDRNNDGSPAARARGWLNLVVQF